MSENVKPERDYSKPVSEEQENFANAMFVASRHGINGDPEAGEFRRMEMRRLVAEFVRRVEARVLDEFEKCVALVGEIPYMAPEPATCCDASLAGTIHFVRMKLLGKEPAK